MVLTLGTKKIQFKKIELKLKDGYFQNVFADKNNKTLSETLGHRRYNKLYTIGSENYSEFLDRGLGEFLLALKENKDDNYKLFLNKYGDLEYSMFYIDDTSVIDKKGIYAYTADNKLKYVGRCLDTFKKRINQGYGKIHPKNCYKDGQATNCHLNSLITKNRDSVSLWVCTMEDDEEIMVLEGQLIEMYGPEWNIASVSNSIIKTKEWIRGEKMVNVCEVIKEKEKNDEFEEFWEKLTKRLSKEQNIRNWTADKGYLGKGDFEAVWRGGRYIECDAPDANTIQKVSIKDFQVMYEYWKVYTIGNMRRADLRDKSRFTKYTMSIIHQYGELMKN
jgi:hypothetical protein